MDASLRITDRVPVGGGGAPDQRADKVLGKRVRSASRLEMRGVQGELVMGG